MANRVVPVFGMHRSGTSALAGALSHMGVYLGDRNSLLVPGTDDAKETNTKGFFEHKAIVEGHEELLRSLQSASHYASGFPSEALLSPAVAQLKASLQQLIVADLDPHEVWGFKDPRSCLFIPLWREILAGRDVRAVIALRNPISVAKSLLARDALTLEHGYQLWLRYMLPAVKETADWNTVVVDYDLLMNDPRGQLLRVQRFIDAPDQVRVSETLGSFLDGSMRHQDVSLQPDQSQPPAAVWEVYNTLALVARGDLSLPEARRQLQSLEERLRTNDQVMEYVGQLERQVVIAPPESEMPVVSVGVGSTVTREFRVVTENTAFEALVDVPVDATGVFVEIRGLTGWLDRPINVDVTPLLAASRIVPPESVLYEGFLHFGPRQMMVRTVARIRIPNVGLVQGDRVHVKFAIQQISDSSLEEVNQLIKRGLESDELVKRLQAAYKESQRIEKELSETHKALNAVWQSNSWKVTAPLRAIATLLKRLSRLAK